MDAKTLRAFLQKTINELSLLLAKLDQQIDNTGLMIREEDPTYQRTHCPICGKTLDGNIVRGVHERCAVKLRRQGTFEKAVAAGIVLPKKQTGPSVSIDTNAVITKLMSVEQAKHQLTERRKKAAAKKGNKHE